MPVLHIRVHGREKMTFYLTFLLYTPASELNFQVKGKSNLIELYTYQAKNKS